MINISYAQIFVLVFTLLFTWFTGMGIIEILKDVFKLRSRKRDFIELFMWLSVMVVCYLAFNTKIGAV